MAHGPPCEVTLNEVIADCKSSRKVIEAVDRIVKESPTCAECHSCLANGLACIVERLAEAKMAAR